MVFLFLGITGFNERRYQRMASGAHDIYATIHHVAGKDANIMKKVPGDKRGMHPKGPVPPSPES
jgi:hypothetical protein